MKRESWQFKHIFMHVYKIYINVVNEYFEKADCGSKKRYFHPNLSPETCTLSIQQSLLGFVWNVVKVPHVNKIDNKE